MITLLQQPSRHFAGEKNLQCAEKTSKSNDERGALVKSHSFPPLLSGSTGWRTKGVNYCYNEASTMPGFKSRFHFLRCSFVLWI